MVKVINKNIDRGGGKYYNKIGDDMKNKKGFTLVELLAVIAILAILVIIALPNVINMYNKAQKETFLTEAKKVYTEAEKKYISSSITGNTIKTISSENSSKLDMTGEKLKYCIILNNNGKVTDMKVSNGKWIASLNDNKAIEDLTIDDLENGNLDGYKCSSDSFTPEVVNCTFNGTLTQGATYTNGQYTYKYKQSKSLPNYNQENSTASWQNMSDDGWGVTLTDLESTEPVTSKVCTYINGKPVVSMAGMFTQSNATSIDLSSFNTELVNDMSGMFGATKAKTLDLSTFNTKNVKNMLAMFAYNQATTITGLNEFDTSNVVSMEKMFAIAEATNIDVTSFNTSKVTNMESMFEGSKVNSLDLSNFDISNVTNMKYMFSRTSATIGYAKDQVTANKFNDSSVTNIPSTLKFTVK